MGNDISRAASQQERCFTEYGALRGVRGVQRRSGFTAEANRALAIREKLYPSFVTFAKLT